MRPYAGLGPVVLTGLLAATARPGAGEHAYVLDSGAKQLVEVDLASGRRVASLPLEGSNPAWLDHDGRYVVVFDRGAGEDEGERGWKASGRSSVTIVDTATLKAIGRVELGSGLVSGGFVADGRLGVLCPGYEAKRPTEVQAPELVLVDLAAAREAGRLRLEHGLRWVGLSGDRRSVALLQGLPRGGKLPYPRSKLWLVDLAGPRVRATLDTGPWPSADSDGERLYLLHRGEPDKNPAKSRNGTAHVVSFGDGRVERLDAGRAPIGWFREETLVGILAEGPHGGPGELRLLRGGDLVATTPVAARPALMGRGKDALYVVGSTDVTVVDVASGQVKGTLPLGGFVDEGDDATEIQVTDDGRRAFVLYGPQHEVAVLDLERGKPIGVAKTGRGGKKLLNSLVAGLGYSMGVIRIPRFDFHEPGRLLARPDGRFAYAINEETKDVTVIDADTALPVERIGGEGYFLTLTGGPTVAVFGPAIHLIDAGRNVKAQEIRVPGIRGVVHSSDCSVVLADRTVLILDAATGRERARLTDFTRPTYVEFREKPPSPAP
jgi:DNA-binding beta-propeller fold protein YncE